MGDLCSQANPCRGAMKFLKSLLIGALAVQVVFANLLYAYEDYPYYDY